MSTPREELNNIFEKTENSYIEKTEYLFKNDEIYNKFKYSFFDRNPIFINDFVFLLIKH